MPSPSVEYVTQRNGKRLVRRTLMAFHATAVLLHAQQAENESVNTSSQAAAATTVSAISKTPSMIVMDDGVRDIATEKTKVDDKTIEKKVQQEDAKRAFHTTRLTALTAEKDKKLELATQSQATSQAQIATSATKWASARLAKARDSVGGHGSMSRGGGGGGTVELSDQAFPTLGVAASASNSTKKATGAWGAVDTSYRKEPAHSNIVVTHHPRGGGDHPRESKIDDDDDDDGNDVPSGLGGGGWKTVPAAARGVPPPSIASVGSEDTLKRSANAWKPKSLRGAGGA